MNMGSATTISISRASSSFTHTLTYSFGSATGTITTKTTSTSISWTPALALANQIPSTTSGTCTITCDTYNGSTKIGTKTCTLTLTVPASVKPTISSLTASRVDGNIPSTWGIYVQSKSKATLTINGAAGSYGSTIKSYSISGGGYSGTSSTLTTGFLNSSGTITLIPEEEPLLQLPCQLLSSPTVYLPLALTTRNDATAVELYLTMAPTSRQRYPIALHPAAPRIQLLAPLTTA